MYFCEQHTCRFATAVTFGSLSTYCGIFTLNEFHANETRPCLTGVPLCVVVVVPAGLTEVMITGGIPPGVDMACSAEVVYRALYKRVIILNERFYRRFPEDKEVVARIVQYIKSQPTGFIELPNGSHLTVRLLQTLGLSSATVRPGSI